MKNNLVYLVNPSEREILLNAGDRMPLGLLYIASSLETQGYDVKVFDLNHISEDDFYKTFTRETPNVVGISVYTSPILEQAVKLAKRLTGKTRLIAGGYHASAMPESMMMFDSIVIGEGETGMPLAINQDGIIRASLVDLTKTPNPDRTKVDIKKYGIDMNRKRTFTISTSRGCPNSCSFCGNLEHVVRYEPIAKVLLQVNELEERGAEALYFVDDVFTINERRMKQIIDGINIPFRATTRANYMNRRKAKILSEKCDLLSFGVESGDKEILEKTNKKERLEDFERTQHLCREYGIKTKGFFILGLPGETETTARRTIDFAKKLRDFGMTEVDFYYMTPFPGTPIWNNPDKFCIKIRSRDFSKYLQIGKLARCVVDTEELKAERIEELVEIARGELKNG